MAGDHTPVIEPTKRIAGRLHRLLPLVAILTVIVTVAALKLAAAVMLPLVSGLFLIAIFWPLQRRLQARMPTSLATGLTLLTFLAIVALFVGALWFSGLQVAQRWPHYLQEFEPYLRVAERYGIVVPGLAQTGNGAETEQALAADGNLLVQLAGLALAVAGGMALVIAYLTLGLPEVEDYQRKLGAILPAGADGHWFDVAHEITNNFHRFIVVHTGIGVATGVLTGVITWLIGLDFAFTWGLIAFLLNYIPSFGSIIAIIFPVLFAIVQLDGWWPALLTLATLGAMQLIMSGVVEPLVQGKYLAPSPFVILLSLVFWGWLWGIAGALLSVPLTILIIMTCRQFDRTRWIAVLLSDVEEEEDKKDP
jgi:AI-2 transport protein TqsA